jgi:hypothetical protein
LGGHASPARNDTVSETGNELQSNLLNSLLAYQGRDDQTGPWQRSLSNLLMKIVHSSSVIERSGMVNIITRSRKKNKIFSQKEKSFPKE